MSEKFDINSLAGLTKTPGLIVPELLKNTSIAASTKTQTSSDIVLSSDDRNILLDYAFSEQGGPGYQSALVKSLSGLRMYGPGHQQIPIADDAIGLAFTSRPLLNLSDDNVQLSPILQPFYRSRPNSIMSYVRGLLDKQWGLANSGTIKFLDPKTAWLTPLTNYLKVSSGFPDLSLTISTSSPGFRQEVYRWVSGILEHNGSYQIRQSYYMSQPKFLPFLFEAWLNYINEVTLGDNGLEPYGEALKQSYQDYDCRIYHIILNRNMRNIEWIFCSASSLPSTYPSGAFSTIDRTQNSLRGQGQDEFDIQFDSIGFRYGNASVAKMFNSTTEYFNPDMKDDQRANKMRALEFSEYYGSGYNQVYPYINLDKMILQYWVAK